MVQEEGPLRRDRQGLVRAGGSRIVGVTKVYCVENRGEAPVSRPAPHSLVCVEQYCYDEIAPGVSQSILSGAAALLAAWG